MERLKRIIPTGCDPLDRFLEGGLSTDSVVLVYGEAETGKTSLSIQCAVNSARMSYKTVFIDSDGTFSTRRLSQIAYYDYESVSPLIVLVRPDTLEEQATAIDGLERYITPKVGLVVVDTVTSLYRVELNSSEKTFALNRELNRQVASLAEVAKTRKVAVLMNSQVRSVFNKEHLRIEPVATRVLKFWADVVINLRHTAQTRVIKAVIEKHPKRKHSTSCFFLIGQTGIRGLA